MAELVSSAKTGNKRVVLSKAQLVVLKTLTFAVINKVSVCLFCGALVDVYASLANSAIFGASFIIEFYSFLTLFRAEYGCEAANSLAMVYLSKNDQIAF